MASPLSGGVFQFFICLLVNVNKNFGFSSLLLLFVVDVDAGCLTLCVLICPPVYPSVDESCFSEAGPVDIVPIVRQDGARSMAGHDNDTCSCSCVPSASNHPSLITHHSWINHAHRLEQDHAASRTRRTIPHLAITQTSHETGVSNPSH
jgi:hypothetical protein